MLDSLFSLMFVLSTEASYSQESQTQILTSVFALLQRTALPGLDIPENEKMILLYFTPKIIEK